MTPREQYLEALKDLMRALAEADAIEDHQRLYGITNTGTRNDRQENAPRRDLRPIFQRSSKR
jgi:hypothetical protein